jgi:hypothetical protein
LFWRTRKVADFGISTQAAPDARTGIGSGKKVNASNPFQISSSLTGNPQHTRRERFKKIFFAVLAVHVILFLTLLIQGCRSGRQASAQAPETSAIASRN